jgi:type II secretory pathway component GspD/PulD (secretin)
MKALRLLQRPVFALRLPVLTLPATLAAPGGLLAQSSAVETPAHATKPVVAEQRPPALPEKVQNFHLKNVLSQQDLMDIQTDLRNAYPRLHVFAVGSRDIITVRGTAEDLELVRQLLADLDQPRPVYRLTFTLTEIADGKRQAAEHFSVLLTAGNRTSLKRGLRVPIETGAANPDDTKAKSQIQYQDAGLTIDAWLESNQLRTKIELSSLSPEKSGIGPQDPVFQQNDIESLSKLTPGKPLLLGSVEMPGGGQQEIEVLAEMAS